jgi:MerR family transcriptional regulator, light-induced transcriptional regulator
MPYRIKTVADLTGIPKNTLVAWERRYGLVDPNRMENGYRVYTDEDVELIRSIKQKVDEGYKISEAVALGQKARARADAPLLPEPTEKVWEALAAELARALTNGDRDGAERIYARTLLSPMDTAVSHVLLPTVRLVGDAWHRGEISIAREHFATNWVREQLGAMLQRVLGGRDRARHAVCATLQGERHELAMLALAVRLGLRGWRVSIVGSDVPEEDLAEMTGALEAELLCLSIVAWSDADEIARRLRNLRQLLPAEVRVAVGGPQPLDALIEGMPRTRAYETMAALLAEC